MGKMKPLVIYHANCADGFGAAFAAWLKLGNEAEYLPMVYNEKLDPSKVQYEDLFSKNMVFRSTYQVSQLLHR